MDLFPSGRSSENEEDNHYRPNATTVYEGISLDELVPNARSNYAFEIFMDSWGFRDRRVISSASLNLDSEVIVADTINGTPLAGENPFCFVAKAKKGESVVIRKVTDIKLSSIH